MNAIDYAGLTPDTVIDAVEAAGHRSDARVLALNSYENRVYQVGIEDGQPLIAKFYRPGRWSDEQIREEHDFCRELAGAELPVVAPLADANGRTLHRHAGYRFALFPRKGGNAPEAGDAVQLYRLGMLIGRIHAVARGGTFHHRPTLDVASFLDAPAALLEARGFVPPTLALRHRELIDALRRRIAAALADAHLIRSQGDCHPGNILMTRDDGAWFLDFDDCRLAPAVQDLWMLLAGSRQEQQLALSELLDGYTTFCDFDARELRLVEALRALRIIHHAGWIAARWEDPAFPRAFPWFNTPHWWQQHLATLEEQLVGLDAEPLCRW